MRSEWNTVIAHRVCREGATPRWPKAIEKRTVIMVTLARRDVVRGRTSPVQRRRAKREHPLDESPPMQQRAMHSHLIFSGVFHGLTRTIAAELNGRMPGRAETASR